MASWDPQDVKLATLARSARARIGAAEGAALRDTDGRSYAAASVSLRALSLTALQVAVAMAVAAGAEGVEAAVVVGDAGAVEPAGLAAVRELAPSAPVWLVATDGTPVAEAPPAAG